jgi:hypothetical protein
MNKKSNLKKMQNSWKNIGVAIKSLGSKHVFLNVN